MKVKEVLGLSIVFILGIISLFFDSQISSFFSNSSNPLFNDIFGLFKPISFYIILALLIMLILVRQHKKQWVAPFISAIFLSLIMSFILKFIIMRPRPLGAIEYIPLLNVIDYSFPSSHTAVIFAILPLLDEELKHYKYLWIGLAVFVALSRLYFNAHYLSDVIFGGLLGYLIGYIILKLSLRKNKKKNKKKN